MFDLYKTIRRIEKALGIKPKNIDKIINDGSLTYYEQLIEKISEWEDKNQKELIY